MIKKKLAAMFTLILFIMSIIPQGVIAAPEAYAFEDYSKFNNVELTSGDMSLSVPLLTIPGRGGMTYSIAMNYHAGIQLDQQADVVGLGWSLNLPLITRSVNGVPDDWHFTGDDDSYMLYKNFPAVFPASMFQNQIKQHESAKAQAWKNMAKQAVIGIALAAATGGIGAAAGIGGMSAIGAAKQAAVSTVTQSGYSALTMSGTFKSQAEDMKSEQKRIKDLITATSTTTTAQPLSGKVYDPAAGGDGTDHVFALDEVNPDSYFVNSPSYMGSWLLRDSVGTGQLEYFLPTHFSASPTQICVQTGVGTCEVNSVQDRTTSYATGSSLPITATENNVIPLMKETFGGGLKGFVIVDPSGTRYLFNTSIEEVVAYDEPNGFSFLPGDIPNAANDEERAYSSFSWIDFYPGGVSGTDIALKNDVQGRLGSGTFLLQDHTSVWGLTKVMSANTALIGDEGNVMGNSVSFTYVDVPLNDGVFTTSNSMNTKSGSEYFDVDEDFSITPTGHKTVARSFKTMKLVDEIHTDTHYAEFVYDYDRYDGKEAYSSGTLDNMPKLSEIKLFAKQGNDDNAVLLERYEFTYDYSLARGAPDNILPIENENSGRLTLKEIRHCSGSGDTCLPPIKFEYANNEEPIIEDICSGLLVENVPRNMCGDSSGLKCEESVAERYCNNVYGLNYVSNSKVCDGGNHGWGDWAHYPGDTTPPCGSSGSDEWVNSLTCDSSSLISCVIADATVNSNLDNTKNPIYIKDARDRWGYFFLSTDDENIHNIQGNSNPSADAWSLTKVIWPTGGVTEWEYEEDKYKYVNDIDLGSSKYGGGLRVKKVINCDGMGQCYTQNYAYRNQDADKYSVNAFELGTEKSTHSSGVTLGEPAVPLYSIQYQQLSELINPYPSIVQSNNFGVSYGKVETYSDNKIASNGITISEFTTAVDYPGQGKYTPSQMYPFYTISYGATGSNNAEPVTEDFIGFDRIKVVPKKGNENYNQLRINVNKKYFVVSSTPGYLFFLRMNNGDDDGGNCDCGTKATVQHPQDAPPFIGPAEETGPCPGEYDASLYCAEIEFEDRGLPDWDHQCGCKDPGNMFLFCPSNDNGLIVDSGGATADNYNPWTNSGSSWFNSVENKFEYAAVGGRDDPWNPGAMDWAHDSTCYFIFGGDSSWDSNERVVWDSNAPGCIDNNNDGNCDLPLVENLGKEVKSYMLGINKETNTYSADNLNDPLAWSKTHFNAEPFTDLESEGVFIGKTNIYRSESMQEGIHTIIDYSNFDPWTGAPQRVETTDSEGRTIVTETLFAYDTAAGAGEEMYGEFGKEGLHMLSVPKTVTISEEGSDDAYLTKTISFWKNNWDVGYIDAGDSANNAWLPYETKVIHIEDGFERISAGKSLAYDKYFNLIVSEDAKEDAKTYYFFGDNDESTQCRDVDGGFNRLYFENPTFKNAVPTCVENELGHTVRTKYDSDYRVTDVYDINDLRTRYAYDGLGRLRNIWQPGNTGTSDSNADIHYDYEFYQGAVVDNPDFDDGLEDWTEWTAYGNTLSPCAVASVVDDQTAVRLKVKPAGTCLREQEVDLDVSETYTISADVKIMDAPANWIQTYMRCRYDHNNDGVYNTANGDHYRDYGVAADLDLINRWQTISRTFSPSEYANNDSILDCRLAVRIHSDEGSNNAGDVFFDHVAIGKPNKITTTTKLNSAGAKAIGVSFFDGLGRNIQSQAKESNTNWIVSYTDYYDYMPAVDKAWRPLRKETSGEYDFTQPTGIYSKTIFEHSPLARVKEVYPALVI